MLLIVDWAVSYENLKTKEKSTIDSLQKRSLSPASAFHYRAYRSNSLNGVFPEKLVVTRADHMQQESEHKERAFEYSSLLTSANSSFLLLCKCLFSVKWKSKLVYH